jgi:DNA invertase Pin-like site-specific DNA recombinase
MVQGLERASLLLYHSQMTSKATANSATKVVVSYIRVSTVSQNQSGLGLEAQQAAIAQYCRAGGYELLQEYREVESGKRNDRPVLKQALARAKSAKAVLLIARLDRLARNVHFVSGLMESGVEFSACDMPSANRLTLHILAAVGEAEALAISTRTKAALAAAKVRGTLLGASNPRCRSLTQENRQKGAATSGGRTAQLAREFNVEATAIARELHRHGMALRAIAAELDVRGLSTRTGQPWSHVQVRRLLQRAAA